jgi:hypothetical protein
MFKRMTLSVFSGAFLALTLAFGPAVMAGCQGYCADRQVGGGVYESCQLTLNSNDEVIGVKCFYTSVKVIDETSSTESGPAA